MHLTSRLQQVMLFVQDKHSKQRRKYTNDPYFFHLYSVAEIVDSRTHNELLVAIALLHDLLEDTDCEQYDLAEHLARVGFATGEGNEIEFILNGVVALTDKFTKRAYPEYNREQRKDMERQRLSEIGDTYQTVKLADLLNNTSSIAKYDPDFAKVYLFEKAKLLKIMKDGDFYLYAQCLEAIMKFDPALIELA